MKAKPVVQAADLNMMDVEYLWKKYGSIFMVSPQINADQLEDKDCEKVPRNASTRGIRSSQSS